MTNIVEFLLIFSTDLVPSVAICVLVLTLLSTLTKISSGLPSKSVVFIPRCTNTSKPFSVLISIVCLVGEFDIILPSASENISFLIGFIAYPSTIDFDKNVISSVTFKEI